MKFNYLGDSTGSPLTNGEQYKIIRSPFMGVDYVEVEPVEQPENTIKLTRTEWQTYEALDLIEQA